MVYMVNVWFIYGSSIDTLRILYVLSMDHLCLQLINHPPSDALRCATAAAACRSAPAAAAFGRTPGARKPLQPREDGVLAPTPEMLWVHHSCLYIYIYIK